MYVNIYVDSLECQNFAVMILVEVIFSLQAVSISNTKFLPGY